MKKNVLVSAAVIIPALGLSMLLLYAYSGKDRSGNAKGPVLSRYGMIPSFSLTNQHSADFGSRDLEGKVWVANFIFTACATECPLISRRMREIQEKFSGDGRVELVSISVDPRTDNPDRLARYAEAFQAGEKWNFLTGDITTIRNISSKGFMVVTPDSLNDATPVRKARQLLHSEKIAVVDQLGVVRFFTSGLNPNAGKQVVEVVRKLLAAEQ